MMALKVFLGALIVTARAFKRHPVLFVVGALIVVSAASGSTRRAVHADQGPLASIRARLTVLEHACVPVNTGGGVTQCAQPTIYELKFARALRACELNGAYVGVTTEDTFMLQAQCMDDWWVSHP